MKLISLKVSKAYGYLPITVDFNDDLTFLVGPNGSGKTTALRLIHAILGPAFEELYSIEFESVLLTIGEGERNRNISIKRRKKEIEIQIDGISDSLLLPEIDLEQLEPMHSSTPRSEAIMEVLRPVLVGTPVFDYLQKQNSPLFLGLDRRLLGADLDEEGTIARSRRFLLARNNRRALRGSMANSLFDLQVLAQEAYRRFRRSQEVTTEKLRRAVLLSAFRYTEVSGFDRVLETDSAQLLGRREEIEAALDNLGIGGADVSKQLNDFFNRLAILFTERESGRGGEIELLTNKAQIERIEELISLIDEHRSSTETAYAQIKKFLDTINSFFSDTRKEIEIDQVGALKVVRPDKVRVGVEALSSGERQLLVIFGHLFFNRYGARSNVFIVDEPELSLHLRWQEMFVSKALTANPAAQLILATHSPEIVGSYKERALNLGIK